MWKKPNLLHPNVHCSMSIGKGLQQLWHLEPTWAGKHATARALLGNSRKFFKRQKKNCQLQRNRLKLAAVCKIARFRPTSYCKKIWRKKIMWAIYVEGMWPEILPWLWPWWKFLWLGKVPKWPWFFLEKLAVKAFRDLATSRQFHWCQMAEFRAAGPKNGPVKFLAA